jgi:hypothetical protein
LVFTFRHTVRHNSGSGAVVNLAFFCISDTDRNTDI